MQSPSFASKHDSPVCPTGAHSIITWDTWTTTAPENHNGKANSTPTDKERQDPIRFSTIDAMWPGVNCDVIDEVL